MLCTNPNLYIFQFMSLVHIHPFQYKLYPNPYSHIFQCMPKIHIHIHPNLCPKSVLTHVPIYAQIIFSNVCLNSYYPTRHMPPNPCIFPNLCPNLDPYFPISIMPQIMSFLIVPNFACSHVCIFQR